MVGGASVCTDKTVNNWSIERLSGITHVLTESANVRAIKRLLRHKCLYLHVDYLRNYLLRDPFPKVDEFQIKTYIPSTDPLSKTGLKASKVVQKQYGSRLVLHVMKMDKSLVRQFKKLSKSPDQNRKKSRRKSKTQGTKITNFFKPDQNSQNVTCKKENDDEDDVVVIEEPPPDVKCYVSTHFHQSVLKRISSLPEMKKVRSRIWGVHFQRPFEPTTLTHGKGNQRKAGSPLPQTFVMAFNSCMEEDSPDRALHMLLPLLTSLWYPPPSILATIYSILLQESVSKICRERARISLTRVTHCHPPATTETRHMYMESFSSETEKKKWTFFSSLITKCISTKSQDCIFLFSTLVGILEEDFKFCLNRAVNPSEMLSNVEEGFLVYQILWPGDTEVSFNSNCKELSQFLCKSLQHDAILAIVQRLLSLVLECVRLETVTDHIQREQSAFSKKCQTFAVNIIDSCALAFQDKSLVGKFLFSVEPVWFQMLVSELLLQTVFNLGFVRISDEPLSLKKIMTYYIFPDLVKSPRKIRTKMSRLSRLMNMKESMMRSCYEKTRIANARNRKGETKLHIACRNGNASMLQMYLSIPGVDVNASDNAGWTPLHEACCQGHKACAELLLQWRPQPGFTPDDCGDDRKCFVDLCAASTDEGLTPLHVALINNHIEAAELVLRYSRKGQKLLELKDKRGRTALKLNQNSRMPCIPCFDSDKEDDCEDRHLTLPGTEESIISQSQCKFFLEYLYVLIRSYLTWYSIDEMKLAWSVLSEAYPVLRPDLVEDMYKAVYSVSSTNETVVKRLYNDLTFFPKLPKYFEKLENHIEKLTGQCRDCFQLEILSLKDVMDL